MKFIAVIFVSLQRRAFIAEKQVPSFFSIPLWKSILFWFFPLLAFFASVYIVAFSKDSLIFNVWSCGALLHPIISIPICVTIDFVVSWFKKLWSKCQTDNRFCFVYTMPLHLGLVCLSQIFLTLEWSTFHEEFLLTSNLTLRASFDNYLSFNQCCDEKKSCGISNDPGLDIGGFITDFVTWISVVDQTNLGTTLPTVNYILIASTLIMVLYFMIEFCLGKLISTITFVIGPPLTNNQNEETEKSKAKDCETETVIVELLPTTSQHQYQGFRVHLLALFFLIQIVCFIFVILCIMVLLLSPEIFHKALTSKLVICHDGLWDDNPDVNLHCIGKLNLYLPLK